MMRSAGTGARTMKALAQAGMANRDTKVGKMCEEFGVTHRVATCSLLTWWHRLGCSLTNSLAE